MNVSGNNRDVNNEEMIIEYPLYPLCRYKVLKRD